MADNPNPNVPLADGQPVLPPDAPVVPPPPPPLPPTPEPIPTFQAPQPPLSNKHGALFHKKKFPVLPLLMVFVLIGGLFAALMLTQKQQETRSKASASDVILLLNGKKEASVGAEIQVSATMSTRDLEVTAAHLVVKFDPEYLEFLGSQPGKALPTLVAKKHASDSAELIVALACNTTCTPYKGSGKEVGSFRFKTLKETVPNKPVNLVFGQKTTITAIGTKENVKGDLANTVYSLSIKSPTTPTPTTTCYPRPSCLDDNPPCQVQPLPPGARYCSNKPTTPTPVACTLEARMCPDGSSVGRVPPSCAFAPCPSAVLYDAASQQ